MVYFPLSFPNFPENLKAPGPGNWQAKFVKEQKEMGRVMFLFSLPRVRTDQSSCADHTLDWQADPGSLSVSQTEDTNPSLVLPVMGHAPRLMVLLQGPKIRSQ